VLFTPHSSATSTSQDDKSPVLNIDVRIRGIPHEAIASAGTDRGEAGYLWTKVNMSNCLM
jgi:hypothetical protein